MFFIDCIRYQQQPNGSPFLHCELKLDVEMIQTGIDETIPKFKERLRSNKSGKVIEQDFADVVQTVFFFLSQATDG